MGGYNSLRDLERKAKEDLRPFFEPKSIAVVGVSRKEGSMGWVIFKNLLQNREKGLLKAEVYGVNIKGGNVFGHTLYRSLTEISGEVEHIIIVVPAKFVPSVLDDAGKIGVKVATIISAGFAEVGNKELDNLLREKIQRYGIRVIGPNCIGILDNYTGVDTLFLPLRKIIEGKELESMPRPKVGHVAFLSQSGALGGTVLDFMYGQNIGISKFVNYGNKMDVDEIDMLLYLKDDPNTRVIMMYIEGIYGKERGKIFYEIAREVSKKKPIVAIKGGKTKAGARAVSSHTASLAGNVKLYETAFKEAGIVYARTLWEFTDMTKALVYQPPARGNKIVIVTNGGGPGILTADYAETIGLDVIKLPEDLVDSLKQYVEEGIIPNVATFSNPIDLSASATEEAHLVAIREALKHKDVDGVILLALHHPPPLGEGLVSKIAEEMRKHKKPSIVLDVGSVELAHWVRKKFDEFGIPSYDTPERAATGFKALVDYGAFLKKEGLLEEYLRKWEPPKIKL
ncbi:MAG: acetate--CoA ligase family protein [Candidatus Njordarchaeia archaeon]